MNRRKFLITASGLFVPQAPSLLLPAKAQVGLPWPGPGGPASGGGGGGGNVSVNQIGTYHYFASATTASYTGLTVNSGTNTIMLATVAWDTNTVFPTITSMNWDSGGTPQAMTRIISGGSFLASFGVFCELWGLIAPHTGNKTLSVSWTNAAPVFINADAFDNVDQTGGVVTFENAAYGTASMSLTIGSHTTDIGVAVGAGNIFSGVLPTQIYLDTTSGVQVNSYSSYTVGSASSVTAGSGTATAIACVNLKQFGRAAQNSLAFVAKSNALKGASGSSLVTGFTTSNAHNDRAIIVLMAFADTNAGTVSGVSLDYKFSSGSGPGGTTQAFTKIAGPINNGSTIGDIYVFGITGITVGALSSIIPTYTGSGQVTCYAYYLTGADQTGGSTTFTTVTTNTGSASLSSVTSTVPASSMVFGVFMGSSNYTSVVSGIDGGVSNVSSTWADASAYQTSSGSQTLSYGPASNNFVAVSACVKSS